jgi:hypothetical protein
MAEETYSVEQIALAHLETALQLYFRHTDYFSVLTLSGVAQELYGKRVRAKNIPNSRESLKAAVVLMQKHLGGPPVSDKEAGDRINQARNTLKHLDAPLVRFDVEQEAKAMLNLAIDEYWLLVHSLTPAMERFQREVIFPQ